MELERFLAILADPSIGPDWIRAELQELRARDPESVDELLSRAQRAVATLDPLSCRKLDELLASSGEQSGTLLRTPAAKTVRRTSTSADPPPNPTLLRGAQSVERTQRRGEAPGALKVGTGGLGSRAPSSHDDLPLGEGSVVHDWYQLERLLGEGAMGQVWKAKDLQRERANDPQPYVALKLVSAGFARHEAAMIAMAREAKKAQELAHPNIATVYVFAVDPGTGQAYLAMELLEGLPLDRLIEEHRTGLRRDRALEIIRGLASGLAYAHSKGIVHCDFKPGNSFVTDAGVAKVLDFGIARLANRVAREGDSFDAGILYALTPPYASLEMLQDTPPTPDPSDDVYALGLVAYELLSGRHPFGREDALVVRANGLQAAPIKGLKRHEWNAIERALRLERAQRWPDAQAFLKALEGTSPWIPALGAVAAVLALVAGYAGYQNYVESKPRIPFDELPTDVRAKFDDAMRLGDYAYGFGTNDLKGSEAARAIYEDAIGAYAEAYALHPKNERADEALRMALRSLGELGGELDVLQRAEARAALQRYQLQYQALAKYEPLERLIEQLAD